MIFARIFPSAIAVFLISLLFFVPAGAIHIPLGGI
jgi:hypothetical protein